MKHITSAPHASFLSVPAFGDFDHRSSLSKNSSFDPAERARRAVIKPSL
jgi:hypothetical protein